MWPRFYGLSPGTHPARAIVEKVSQLFLPTRRANAYGEKHVNADCVEGRATTGGRSRTVTPLDGG
jgi:hypothetical protein